MRSIQNPNFASSLLPPTLIAGFAGAIAALVAWFVTHLPMLALSEPTARFGVLAAWFVALLATVRWAGSAQPLRTGLGAGLLSAVIGAVLIAGTRTRPEVTEAAPVSEPAAVSVLAVALGFIAVGIVLGLVAGVISRAWTGSTPTLSNHAPAWRSRFALVTAAAVAPLLFIGGLVTSTDSGMAVPDWPTTFNSNMLNYPLGPKTPQDIFLEHAHRLFGMLVGLASITLMVWVLLAGVRGWPRLATVFAFVLICVQGLLGGIRVRIDSRPLAMLHGVLGQLVFGLIVALAAYLSPAFTTRPTAASAGIQRSQARRLRAFSTGLMHALILQLVLGAVARHFRKTDHAMWTHAALSVVVVTLATMVGFAVMALPRVVGGGPLAGGGGGIASLRRCGPALIAVVTLQFLLGWAAFLVRGPKIQAESTLEALIRTAHQANGALLIGLAACAFVWSRWLWRGVRDDPSANAAAESPAPVQAAPRVV